MSLIIKIKNKEDSFFILSIKIPDLRVLMTSGLSQLKMDVHEKHVGEEFETVLSSSCLLARGRLYKEEMNGFLPVTKIKII